MPDNPRVAPHSIDAEQALLGSILLRPDIIDEAAGILKPAEFYRPAHGKIFQYLLEMRQSGMELDTLTVVDYIESHGGIEECGGKVYFLDVTSAVSSSQNWNTYAEIVHEKYQYRRIIEIGNMMMAMGYDAAGGDIDDAISISLASVNNLAVNANKSTRTTTDIIDSIMTSLSLGKSEYITPYGVDLARMTKGDLVVCAAGTSIGKTAITLDWADHWSRRYAVTYFEYEMKEEQLISRLICKHAKVSMEQIQDGTLTLDEVERVEQAADIIRSRKLKVEEVWCDVGTLMAKIRREAHNGTDIVIVDHLGLIPMANREKGVNEAKAVGRYITNPLKRLASELGIIIVLLVQLNREGQKDAGFPRLYHLRDSGEIEQDASVVLMMWSERQIKDEWSKRVPIREKSGLVSPEELTDDSFYVFRIGVEKNRNGKLGEKFCLYKGEHFEFDYRNTMETVAIYDDRKMFDS